MASSLTSRAPQCSSCVRRLTNSLRKEFQLSPGHQIRGKKRVARAKVKNVKAFLLQDVAGYGPPGAVVPVTAGIMRNEWYPKKIAQYLTLAKMQELGLKRNDVAERDPTFKSTEDRELEKQKLIKQKEMEAREAAERMDDDDGHILETTVQTGHRPELEAGLEILSPSQATTILESCLPANLEFYRTPITMSRLNSNPKHVRPEEAEEELQRDLEQQQRTGIYGSVTTNDIATNLKAILLDDPDGARVVLSASDISLLDEAADKDRVKYLGKYEFEIRLEGATESVRRIITVNAQE